MDNRRLFLWHWEALYPYDLVQKGLSSLQLPEEFPKERMFIALPHDYLEEALVSLKDSPFNFGSSDMLDATPETFTGSVAAKVLTESKANFVIIGKAFDRNQIKESPVSINYKVKAALEEKIVPFFCFGETREEFEDGHAEEVVKEQLSQGLKDLSPEEVTKIYFVYDTPGLLKTISDVTVQDLNKVHEMTQKIYASLWGEEAARQVKTICALEPFKPLPRVYFENSPFAGFYFQMIDANLSFFCDAAKEIAPFFEIAKEIAKEIATEATVTVKKRKPRAKKKVASSEEGDIGIESEDSNEAMTKDLALMPPKDVVIYTNLAEDPFLGKVKKRKKVKVKGEEEKGVKGEIEEE